MAHEMHFKLPSGDSSNRYQMDLKSKAIKRRAMPCIGLGCILILYVLAVFRFHPPDLFGETQDDSLYFTSAKALADHQGYILPSVPGQPVATKYPILFPWILSWVWRLNPSFPSNLSQAVAVVIGFGVIFIVCSFLYLRRLKGGGEYTALLITFFMALHPVVIYYSASVLSDIPFAALSLAAMLLADKAMRSDGSDVLTASCAMVTGLAILMRVFGIPIAAGILVAALARRAWRQIAIFCAVLVPFGVGLVSRWFHVPPAFAPPSAAAMPGTGFARAWLYYTSYLGFWKFSVPNLHILWAMLKNNAIIVLLSPSDFFLAPLFKYDHIASVFLMLLVTFAVFAGIVRQWKEGNWNSIHCAFPFYVAVTWIWNYPNTGRFFFLFLPLFASALWDEIEHFLSVLNAAVAKSPTTAQRTIAQAFTFGLLALCVAGVVNYVGGVRKMVAEALVDRGHLLQEKREAYSWLSCCTAQEDRVVAYEDVNLYLYSGHQGMRPIIFPTSVMFDEKYLQETLAGMPDVASAIGARYWFVSDDDFSLEWDVAASKGRAREVELTRNLPVAFQSQGGHIRIYKIACDDPPNVAQCP
jgi:hypothetical protein